jgi:hypothetical protein
VAVKEAGQVLPVLLPCFESMPVLRSAILLETPEGIFCHLPVGGDVDFPEVGTERLPILPDEVFAPVVDLMVDAEAD